MRNSKKDAKCKVNFCEEADSIPAYARVHKILAKDPAGQVGFGNQMEPTLQIVRKQLNICSKHTFQEVWYQILVNLKDRAIYLLVRIGNLLID